METIEKLKKEMCTGCWACTQICPRHCIDMRADQEGFLYPTVDHEKCVSCGLCTKVCPVIHQRTPNEKDIAYAARSKDTQRVANSSSGGLFSTIAEHVIQQGGVVFGAALDGDQTVKHMKAESKEELVQLMGSKYVQSEIGRSYELAKRFLDEGRMVYFTGTPCHVAGLLNYLGKDYSKLITQDIVCHGVPSPDVWRKYVQYQEKKHSAPVSKVSFRNKDTGWKSYSISIAFENGRFYRKSQADDMFMRGFLSDLYLRPSCYACNFKGEKRSSDITLADFWGVEDLYPECYDSMGVSLVYLHTDKAKQIFSEIEEKIECHEVDGHSAVQRNSAIIKAPKVPEKRSEFMKALQGEPYIRVMKKYCRRPFNLKRTLWKVKQSLLKK